MLLDDCILFGNDSSGCYYHRYCFRIYLRGKDVYFLIAILDL